MIICKTCNLIMRNKEGFDNIGVPVIELDPKGNPCRIWWGDKLTCLGCGTVVIGHFSEPITKRDSEFVDFLEQMRQQVPAVMEVK